MSCTLVSAISTARPRHSASVTAMTLRPGLASMHTPDIVEDARPVARGARDHGVGVAMRHHQRGEDVALVEHQALAVAAQLAAPLQALVE